MQPMRLDLQIGGLSQAVAGMNRLAAGMQKLADAQKNLNQAVNGTPGTGAGGGVAPRGGGVGGPFSRMQRAQANLQAAFQSGDPMMVADARINAQRAQRAAARAGMELEGKRPGNTFDDISGAIQGGIAGAAIGATIGLWKTAVQSFVSSLNDAASAAREFANVRDVSGGTTGQAALLQALGISADLGGRIRGRITSDPFARAQAGARGIHALPEPFGTTNNAQFALRSLEVMRQMTKEEDRLRFARAIGAEELLRFVHMSDASMAQAKRDAEERAKLMADPTWLRASADFDAAVASLQFTFQDLVMVIGREALPLITEGLRDLTKHLREAAKWFAENPDWAKAMGGTVKMIFGVIGSLVDVGVAFAKFGAFLRRFAFFLLPDSMKGLLGPFLGQDDLNTAQERFIRAIDRNTGATLDLAQTMKPGTYGGGEFARGAFPGQWHGTIPPHQRRQWFDAQMDGQNMRFGAFAL